MIRRRRSDTGQIQDGRRRVNQADNVAAAELARNQPRCGDEKWDVDVLVVQGKGVPVVALMLPEGFAVIAEDDPQRALRQASRAQTVDERAERSIAVG